MFFTTHTLFYLLNQLNAMHIWSSLWILMPWCFSTRASVATLAVYTPILFQILLGKLMAYGFKNIFFDKIIWILTGLLLNTLPFGFIDDKVSIGLDIFVKLNRHQTITWIDGKPFTYMAQAHAYSPQRSSEVVMHNAGDWTHNIQISATSPAASSPNIFFPDPVPKKIVENWQPNWNEQTP